MNLSFNYQKFTPSNGKNMGIRKSDFVTKTQFLSLSYGIMIGNNINFGNKTVGNSYILLTVHVTLNTNYV